MRHTLLHIYGPIALHSFGVMIAFGLIIFTWLLLNHPLRKKIISKEKLIDVLLVGIGIAVIGGRFLFIMSERRHVEHWTDIFNVLEGGFSILGSVLGTLIISPWYLKRHTIPVIPFLDLIALHAPLLQSISRIGCFLAGCCHGMTTTVPWAVIYTDTESLAPLGLCIHPTQLYSALILLLIFLFLYYRCQSMLHKFGQMTCMYLILISMERFWLDFYRGDKEFFAIKAMNLLSINQWIALGLCIFSIIILIYIRIKPMLAYHESF